MDITKKKKKILLQVVHIWVFFSLSRDIKRAVKILQADFGVLKLKELG